MKRLLVVLALLALVVPRTVLAQVDRATLTGTVKDSGGAIIPGATVSITNVATNVASQQQTTETGSYLFVNLIPGQYRIDVELSGFKKTSQLVTLEVGQRARVDAALEVGSFSETVKVTESTQLINSNDATLGGVTGDSLVHGDGFSGRRVDEKKLLLDAKGGMAGHDDDIDPARRSSLTTGRIWR